MVNKSLRILIVEENNYHGLMMEREIAQRLNGPVVMISRSGREALDIVKLNHFDIAVVDLDLSDHDGLVFLRRLCEGMSSPAVIALVNDNSEKLARELSDLGCDEVLVKDSSFHVVVPRMVIEVYGRMVRRAAVEGVGKESLPASRPCLNELTAGILANEMNHPLEDILKTVEQLLTASYRFDVDVAERVTAIERAARQMHSSLRKLTLRTSAEVHDSAERPPVREKSTV